MDELESLFKADAQQLRNAAPTSPPTWRIHQRARERAAMRVAVRVRWAWRLTALLLLVGAMPIAYQDARLLPMLASPLLVGALVCWRDASA